MTKSMHSTTSHRQTLAGTAAPQSAGTAPEGRSAIRELCRRWRYAEAKLNADMVILDEKEFDRRAQEVEEELRTIEGQILDAEPEGPNDAAEILRVVLELTGEDSAVDHRDTALLRQALRALALARHDQQPAEPADEASEIEPAKSIDDLFAEWDANRQQSQGGISDEQAELLNKQELMLMEKIIAAPATSAGDIAAKVVVAKELIQQSGSRWSDERDVKVLDSIQRDLSQFGSVLGAQRAPAPVEGLAWDMALRRCLDSTSWRPPRSPGVGAAVPRLAGAPLLRTSMRHDPPWVGPRSVHRHGLRRETTVLMAGSCPANRTSRRCHDHTSNDVSQ